MTANNPRALGGCDGYATVAATKTAPNTTKRENATTNHLGTPRNRRPIPDKRSARGTGNRLNRSSPTIALNLHLKQGQRLRTYRQKSTVRSQKHKLPLSTKRDHKRLAELYLSNIPPIHVSTKPGAGAESSHTATFNTDTKSLTQPAWKVLRQLPELNEPVAHEKHEAVPALLTPGETEFGRSSIESSSTDTKSSFCSIRSSLSNPEHTLCLGPGN